MASRTNRKFLLAWFFLLVGLTGRMLGQAPCASEATPDQIRYMTQTREARQNFDVATLRGAVKWVPITFHNVTRTNGTGGLNTTVIPTIISDLNRSFGPANIQFFQCGPIETINNDTYFDLTVGRSGDPYPAEDAVICGAHDVPNTLNMYFFNSFYSTYWGPGVRGLAYFPGGPERVLIETAYATNGSRTIEHEVGHFFSLYHTHQNTGHSTLGECANGSNCAIAGDEVCDTPAEPTLGLPSNTSGCTYIGSALDPCGQPYVPNMYNYMNYTSGCGSMFSAGQYNRMAWSAMYERANLACAAGTNAPCTSIVTTFPYTQGFESGNLGDWSNATNDNFDWSVVTAAPHAPTTGPTAAAVGTKFAYIEANGNTSHKIASLDMPCFDLTYISNPRVEFRYHMVGTGTGTLKLEGSSNGGASWTTLFFKEGAQASGWQTQVVDLSAYASQTTFKFRISATTTANNLGDIAIDNFRVYSQPCAFTPTISHVDLTCSYLPTGSASISGAPGGSTYNWAKGDYPTVSIGTTASISNLQPGAYQVTVTSSGCSSVHGTYIEENVFRILATQTHPTLTTSGSLNIQWQGGVLPYSSLSWTGPVSGSLGSITGNSYNLTGLPAGIYSIQMTDAIGCVNGTSESLVGITPACPCAGSIGIGTFEGFESGLGNWTNCAGFDAYDWAIGTGDMSPTGTTGPTTSTAPNAPNGAYAGNQYAYAVSNDFDPLYFAESVFSSPCLDFTGVAHPTMRFYYHNYHSSGTVDPLRVTLYNQVTGSLEMLWESDVTSSDAWREVVVDLTSAGNTNGIYEIVFSTYPMGATTNDVAIDNFELFDGGAGGFVSSVTTTPASCGNTATASVNASCSGAITYAWSHGPTTAAVTGLAGNTEYYVTVTCAGAPCARVHKVKTSVNDMIPSTNITHVVASGQTNGAVDLFVTGGKTPYTYNWTGPSGFTATTQDISNRGAGTYNVTVTDALGCTKTAIALIYDGGCPNLVNANGYDESWEADFGKWNNITGEATSHFDWTRKSGASNGTSSGPATANHGSFYLYTNSNATPSGATAHLISHCIDLTHATTATFTFDWHAYKTTSNGTMGTLYLDVTTNQGVTWTQLAVVCSTSVGNQWNVRNQSLNAYVGKVIQLRFREVMGSANKGDIALDHPRITGTYMKADPANSADAMQEIVLYPNPTQDRVNIDFVSRQDQSVQCRITDLTGKVLRTWAESTNDGPNHLDFSTRDLSDGIYFIQLEVTGQRITKRFVVLN